MVGMIIVGGIILDKWGIRVAGLAFGGLAALGGAIVAMGKCRLLRRGQRNSAYYNDYRKGPFWFRTGGYLCCCNTNNC